MFALVRPVKLLSVTTEPVCVVVPVTVRFPLTVRLLATVTSFGRPMVSVSVALTATSTSLLVPATVKVSPPAIVCVFEPSESVKLVDILAVLAPVILPLASTANTGIAVALPYVAAETPEAANDTAPLLTEKSPVNDATPLFELVASSAAMVIVPLDSVTSTPSPAVKVIVPPNEVAVELLPSVTVIALFASFAFAIEPASCAFVIVPERLLVG